MFDRQYRKKHNIRFSRDKERVTYIENERFEYDAEASYPLTEDDKLVVLNMHMNVSRSFIMKIGSLIYLFVCLFVRHWLRFNTFERKLISCSQNSHVLFHIFTVVRF